jgi:hypothetical protein
MRVPIFLLVDWIRKTDFILDLVVGSLGVGSVERNIVANTIILKQERNYPQQKTITMPFVVERKRDFLKKRIVEEGVQAIAQNAGNA